MGKYEVLGFLAVLRDTGDEEYYTYVEVFEKMRSQDLAHSYMSVWRSMNSLWNDGLLEAVFEGDVVQRTAKFRAKERRVVHGSGMKKVYNMPLEVDEKSGRGSTRSDDLGVRSG